MITKGFMINMVTGRRNQVLKCKVCGLQSTKSFEIENHVRRHSKSRPFICNKCGFSFTTQGNKTRHQANGSCLSKKSKAPKHKQSNL